MKPASDCTISLFRPELVLGLLLVLLFASAAPALIMVQKGNEPTQDHNWPAGSLDVANLKTRLGFWEGPPFGGGQYCFEYRGDTAAFQAALDAFARIKAPKLELSVHEGPRESFILKDPGTRRPTPGSTGRSPSGTPRAGTASTTSRGTPGTPRTPISASRWRRRTWTSGSAARTAGSTGRR